MIVAGDPNGSPFIQLLEGNGQGAYSAMPPGRTQSFKERADDGQTDITMAQVRMWVRNLEGN